jgi:hypothetical protein
MTKSELIAAYVSGRIDRRDFVRRLTALGVSATAAAAYAQSLTPGASAAGVGRDPAGMRVRGRDQEYGVGGEFGEITDVINLQLQLIDIQLSILGGLENLKAAPLRLQGTDQLDPADVGQLDTMRTQLQAHRDALAGLVEDFGASASVPSVPEFSYSTIDDMLSDLQLAQEAQLGIYAAVIPTITGTGPATASAHRTFVQVSLVEGRHAAFVNRLLGDSAFPETFQPTATPDEVDGFLSGLGG